MSEATAYQISTVADLIALSGSESDWDKHFILTNDLDLQAACTAGGAAYNDGQGFSPIGSSTTRFTGSFNGNENEISWLLINRSETYHIGLFGIVDGATIKNLSIKHGEVHGSSYVGGLVAHTDNSTVLTDCSFDGIVSGVSNVGGLVGYNYYSSTISRSQSSGSVTGKQQVGGLVGQNYSGHNNPIDSLITLSHSSAQATATTSSVGGLAGLNGSASIVDCHSSGEVTGGQNAGGLVGLNNVSAEVERCYSSGFVSGYSSNVGGLVGNNANGSKIRYSYYDRETSLRTDTNGTPLLTSDFSLYMQPEAGAFANWGFGNTDNAPWVVFPDGRPLLYWQDSAIEGGYEAWALKYDLTGDDALPSTSIFKDGVTNSMRHYFGLGLSKNVTATDGATPGLPAVTKVDGILKFVVLRTQGVTDRGSEILSCTDLSLDQWHPEENFTTILTEDGQYVRMELVISNEVPEQFFRIALH